MSFLPIDAVPSPDDETVRQQLRDILKRPEFGTGVNPLAWMNAALRDFFTWLGALGTTNPVLYWLLLVGCIMVLAALLFHIGWTIRRVFILPPRAQSAEEEARQRLALSQVHRNAADRHARAGDFTEAIRSLFLAVVFRLDEQGRVPFHKAVTNREYLALFHDRPRALKMLSVFVDVLDEHWYGERPAAGGQFERCLGLYNELVRVH